MTDITEMNETPETNDMETTENKLEEILQPEKPSIRPLDVIGRVPLYVYCTSYKGSRQLSRYGDVGYTSAKSNFTLVYVNEADADEKVEQIKQLKFVKMVKKGHLKELTHDFSASFEQINLEIKREMNLAETEE